MPSSFQLRSMNPRAVPGRELKFPGSKERVVGRDGDLNGYDKKDLLKTIATLLTASSNGEVDDRANNVVDFRKQQKESNQMMIASFNDRSSNSDWVTLGSTISAAITQSADREGFMRRLLMRADLNQSQFPRIRIRKKDVTAMVMASAAMVQPQYLRDNWLFPPEFTVSANIRVEKRELNQGTGDLLEEKFYEGQESIMVLEDRYWKQLADNTIGIDNNLQYLTGGLNPSNFSSLRTQLMRWNITPLTVVMAADFWDDIIGNTDFSSWFDPMSKYEIINTGTLGSMLGLTFITDGFRQQNLQVLQSGEVYVVGDPVMHGAYTDRGPVESNAVDQYSDGVPARGWFMFEELSMVIANSRSVIKGIRN